ncbi:hypothetical protein AJ79_04772 [Helicocarpus griseus UAMH5409]|uniref:Response regulatory domain-containing protein n=1 Tax=Helicocarpus griseus UAMH5409 TaxID=1447875 RepID=A0A2B7XSM4_9EURO|nr:hypothetical protein AJ79_04772 [Helicocarpus griseus UAMH5409]
MIREWEQKHNVPRTPIIGAIASNWHREKCVSFGMDEVILKPLREKTLQDSLRQYAKGPTPKDNSTMV